jgi:hypothetical protein
MQQDEGFRVHSSANYIHFFVSYTVALLAFGFIGKWYLWPAIRDRAPATALPPLLLYACLRVNGLMFLMPGLVSPDLPRTFAIPTAYGDLAAAVLALLAAAAVHAGSRLAVPMVWVFNMVGFLDLIYANVSSLKDNVDPVLLGVSYYLAVLNVPAMLVVHVIIFCYLLRQRPRTSPL